MLGIEINPAESFVQIAPSAPASGVVSLVGLAGSWVGAGSISCSSALACRISAAWLAAEFDSVNDDVLDAIAELTNMIVGNVKTSIEDRLGALAMSVPTVIYGNNFQTRSRGNHAWVVAPFDCEGGRLHVQICLIPSGEPAQRTTRQGFPMPHALNS